MRLLTSPQKRISSRHLSAAAEKIAAAHFELCGFDVLEQGGRTRRHYDLSVLRSGAMMKVTVHGSLDGFWDLVDPYLDKMPDVAAKADYHRAIDLWLERHSHTVACCLVQFESTDPIGKPRIYLASAAEVAEKLHETADSLCDSALYEQYEVTEADGSHTVEGLPTRWNFSRGRIAELMARQEPIEFRFSSSPRCKACAEAQPAACLDCLPMMN